MEKALSNGTECSSIEFVHGVVGGVPVGRESAIGAISDDIDCGNASNGVHGQMVVGDETAIVGDEATLSPSIASSVPQTDGYRLSILHGIAFKSELIATTPHHVEEDAEARTIVLRSGLCTPILRTEAEGVFVVAC